MKLKRKEFADLKQGGMTVNVYLNSFIQLSRYAPDDINWTEATTRLDVATLGYDSIGRGYAIAHSPRGMTDGTGAPCAARTIITLYWHLMP
jgi:hypothetical protein